MENKINKIKLLMKESSLTAILISSVSNIIYLTDYCGFSYFEREAFLVITNKENYLITDGRYGQAVSSIAGFKLIEISSSNTLTKIFEDLSKKIKKIGIEENDLSVAEYRKIRKYFKTVNLADLQSLRIIKDSFEIKSIEKACKFGDEAFDHILGKIKKGVTERKLAFEIEFFIKKKGADISFPPIVAFSANSSIPHHKTSNRKLKTDNIILLDFGVKYQNYCSDMTRTIFFGKADHKFKKIYKTVLESQQKAIDYLASSFYPRSSADKKVKASNVDRVARKHITDNGFPTIPHSLGHGIGIEVHEQPRLSPKSKDILTEGMVFSIEPGIYISGYGGVRIEDIFVIESFTSRRAEPSSGQSLRTAAGRRLTHSPKHLIEI